MNVHFKAGSTSALAIYERAVLVLSIGSMWKQGKRLGEHGEKRLCTDRWKVTASQTSRVERETPTLCAPFSVSPTIDNQEKKLQLTTMIL